MTADLNISTTNTNTHSFPTGSYVEIFSMGKGNETKLRATCTLQKDKKIICEGDLDLVEELKQGFRVYFYPDFELVTTQDGIKFLLGLGSYFNTPYLYASEIKIPKIVV